MNKTLRLLPLLVFVVTLAGCSNLTKAKVGSLAFNGGDATVKALILETDGAFIDGLTREEQINLTASETRALEYGKPGKANDWSGGRSDVSGSVVAFQLYRVGNSSCRRFEHKMLRKGQKRQAAGTACKRNDGQWKLVI